MSFGYCYHISGKKGDGQVLLQWDLCAGLYRTDEGVHPGQLGIIVVVHMFSMLVLIMKLLDHPTNAEMSHDKEERWP